ncbi:MAG: thiamine diphosphokinase [Pseudomonadota bacterium]
MIETIVSSTAGLTLLGGGHLGTNDLSDALSLAPDLVAADGGAAAALAQGNTPLAVIGDMDSLQPRDQARLPDGALHHVAEQDSTDFDKVLARVAGPFALGVGFLGRRIDHQLANLHALVRLRHMPCLLIGERDVVFAAPPRIALALSAGTRVSLFPLAPVGGTSDGLHWPIDGLAFSPWERHGTSNRVADGASGVRLEMGGAGLIVILPRAALAAAVAGLRAAPLWPEPARAG